MAGNCAYNYNNTDFNVHQEKALIGMYLKGEGSAAALEATSRYGMQYLWIMFIGLAAIYDQSGIFQHPSRMRRDCTSR